MSALSELYKEIAGCRQCGLSRSRTKPVPGEGPEDSEIMFIGEAPGWNEDQQGRPFVGQAGQYLEGLLASIHLKREQVYIGNVVKCRPPQNREPLPDEIKACHAFLQRQIELIHPRMIITLGRYSLGMFFPGETIGKVHGTARKHDGVIYFAMYHPAAALHQQSLRPVLEADMLKIPPLLAKTEVVEEKKPEPPEKQLNLFG